MTGLACAICTVRVRNIGRHPKTAAAHAGGRASHETANRSPGRTAAARRRQRHGLLHRLRRQQPRGLSRHRSAGGHEPAAARSAGHALPGRRQHGVRPAPACTPSSIAQVARPTGGMVPVNTIRMERTGRRLSPSSAAPLLTDLQTAERARLPHTAGGGRHRDGPGASRGAHQPADLHRDPAGRAVARAPAARTPRALGGRRAPQTVITEMRNPPMTIIEQGGNVRVQR